MRHGFYILIVCSLFSCKQNNSPAIPAIGKHKNLEPALIVKVGKPIQISIENCPPAVQTSFVLKRNIVKDSTISDLGFYITMKNYNTEDGLALSSVLCGYKDRLGNLWIGTDGGGVSRYDGKSFTNYNTELGLANNSVMSILEDHNNNLWFGTNGGGVSFYDGKAFTTFNKTSNLSGNSVFCITVDTQGNILFGTDAGVSFFNGKSFSNYAIAKSLQHHKVSAIACDNAGDIWFGTDEGAALYDGKLLTTFTASTGLTDNKVLCITPDNCGTVWIGTQQGVVSYNGKFNVMKGLKNSAVKCITIDKKGIIWFGTLAQGVSSYDGKNLLTFKTEQGIANNSVRSITQDNSGNLWFGTYGTGLSKYVDKSLSNASTKQGLADNAVNTITQDKYGAIWFGTDGHGVSCFTGNKFTNLLNIDGLANNTIISSFEDKAGNIWLGTKDHGVSCYDGKSFKNFTSTQGLVNNTVWVISQDKQGNMWFGTNGGISSFDGSIFKSYTTKEGLPNNVVRSLTHDRFDNIWIGTVGGGVSLYNGRIFANFTTAQGIGNNTVYCITPDKWGNLWIGTAGGGISLLTASVISEINSSISSNSCVTENKGEKIFRNFSTADGLADNVVYDIVEDPKGNIFVGTNLGFTVLSGGYDASKRIVAKNGIQYFNQKNGYPIKDVNVNAMYVDAKGIIWAGTGDKLVRFDFDAVSKFKTKPTVVIQSLKINNQKISWYDLLFSKNEKQNSTLTSLTTDANITEEALLFGNSLSEVQRDSMNNIFGDISFDRISRFYPLPLNLMLAHNYNNLNFEYAAIEPARPFLVKYQFMLVGYDQSWNPVTDKTNANFGNLYEGDYVFKIKAQSPEGIWSEPVSYPFKILPPWFRTWWAYLIYVLAIVSLMWSYIKWRENSLQKENEQLEKKVFLRTSELLKEKDKSEQLLLNIFPSEIAKELKTLGTSKPKSFKQVSVLFTDFKNFTMMSEQLNPEELVSIIDFCYRAFDDIISKHNIEKIKTIGDSYMCAGGLPIENKTNAQDAVNAALEIRDFINAERDKRNAAGNDFFDIRIGVHTGAVIAGIVGFKKYAYDIWGDTVNIASRMESSGEPNKVNISGSTFDLVKEHFYCSYRGKIVAKNKGEIDMYFVDSAI